MKVRVLGIFYLLIGVYFTSFSNATIYDYSTINHTSDDQIDQQQTLMYAGAGPSYPSKLAQSFKPSVNTLTRVQLYLGRDYSVSGNIKISIRSTLIGPTLTSISISAQSIPYPDCHWVEFNFPDITVVPEQTYYMIFEPSSSDSSSVVNWGFYNQNDNYHRGSAWSYSPEDGWTYYGPDDNGMDYTFKTYGKNNAQGDLSILLIEPIQIIFNPSGFVVNKNVFFLVRVSSTYTSNVQVNFKINAVYQTISYIDKGPNENGITIKPGSMNTIFLPGGPGTSDPVWNTNYIIYWPTAGTDTGVSIEINPDHKVQETDYGNNIAYCPTMVFRESRGLDICYVRMIASNNEYAPASPSESEQTREKSSSFIQEIYPIKKNGVISSSIDCVLGTSGGWVGDLWRLDRLRDDIGHDRIVGLVSSDYFNYIGMKNVVGFTDRLVTSSITMVNYWSAPAHEIHHNLPNWDDWRAGNEEYDQPGHPDGFASYGLRDWSWECIRNQVNGDTCFMGTSPYQYSYFNKFVCDECYNHLYYALRKGNDIKTSGKMIHVSGIVNKNHTVLASDSFVIENSTAQYPNSTIGDYSVILKGPENQTIMDDHFNLSFQPYATDGVLNDSDLDCFAFHIPYPENISLASVEIHYLNSIIHRQIISNNTPTIHLIAPNGGEVINVGESVLINWEAQDADADNLNYILLCSEDDGKNWAPIVMDLNQTSFLWNTTNCHTSNQCLIRVIASDGFNTGIDNSNATFTLYGSPPTIPVMIGPSEAKIGQLCSYKVRASDPNHDIVYYLVDWNDGTNSSWVGPFESGEEITINHTFYKSGSFNVISKAKDFNDASGNWSNPSEIAVKGFYSLIIGIIQNDTINDGYHCFSTGKFFLYLSLKPFYFMRYSSNERVVEKKILGLISTKNPGLAVGLFYGAVITDLPSRAEK
jgi:hypothetical protein